MCFSATASFVAGVSLVTTGIYGLHKPHDSRYTMLKTVPLLFGIQQLCEGMVWITQLNESVYSSFFKYAFLFYAFFLWPFYIPITLVFLTDGIYKKIQYYSFGVGSAVALILAYLSWMHGVSARISCHHVDYFFNHSESVVYPLVVLYCLTTVGSFFVANNRKLTFLGILLGASVAISAFCYTEWFTSVWCFFAALVSFYIVLL